MKPLLVWGAGVCLAASLSASLSAAPTLTVGSTQVTADSLTPQGQSILFGVAREPLPWQERVVHHLEVLTDSDGDGSVSFQPSGGVAAKSAWTVVDLATGELASAAPAGFTLDETSFDLAAGWVRGTVDLLQDARQRVRFLVVRPAGKSTPASAWHCPVADGSPEDTGAPSDGRVEVLLSAFDGIALSRSAAPAAPNLLLDGDRVVAIDTVTLAVSSALVSTSKSAGGVR